MSVPTHARNKNLIVKLESSIYLFYVFLIEKKWSNYIKLFKPAIYRLKYQRQKNQRK